METFFVSLANGVGNSPIPVNSPQKGQWRGALMFSFICVWINGWVNNREAGDLRRYRIHYDVTVMIMIFSLNRHSVFRSWGWDMECDPSLELLCLNEYQVWWENHYLGVSIWISIMNIFELVWPCFLLKMCYKMHKNISVWYLQCCKHLLQHFKHQFYIPIALDTRTVSKKEEEDFF